MSKETDKKVDDLLAEINKDYFKEVKTDRPAIFRASERPDLITARYYPTGITVLDRALGGGLPYGSVVNVHGSPWAGKTALLLTIAAKMSREQKYAIYVNLEGIPIAERKHLIPYDENYLIILEPVLTGERVIDMLESLIFDKASKLPRAEFAGVFIDSLNILAPEVVLDKVDKEGASGVPQLGARAKLIDNFLTRLYARGVLRDGTIVCTIAHDRANIAGGGPMAPKTIMSCGESLKYNAKVTIKLSREMLQGTNKESSDLEWKKGHKVKFDVEKNSIYCKIAKGEYTIMYDTGLDDSEALFAKALEDDYQYIRAGSKRGTYLFIIPGLGDIEVKGKKEAAAFLRDNPEAADVYRSILTTKLKEAPEPCGFPYVPKKTVADTVEIMDDPEIGEETE